MSSYRPPCRSRGRLALLRAARARRRPAPTLDPPSRRRSRGSTGKPARDRQRAGRVSERVRRSPRRLVPIAASSPRGAYVFDRFRGRSQGRAAGRLSVALDTIYAGGRCRQAHPARGRHLVVRRDAQRATIRPGADVRDVPVTSTRATPTTTTASMTRPGRRQRLRRLGGARKPRAYSPAADARHGDLRLLRLRGTGAVRQRLTSRRCSKPRTSTSKAISTNDIIGAFGR